MQYRKRDSVEKLFLSSKSFLGAEPLRVHGLETLRGNLFVNMVSLAIQKTTESEDKNLHDHEKKRPGAQPGHIGHFRMKSKPTRRIRINLDIHQCPECNSSLRRKGK